MTRCAALAGLIALAACGPSSKATGARAPASAGGGPPGHLTLYEGGAHFRTHRSVMLKAGDNDVVFDEAPALIVVGSARLRSPDGARGVVVEQRLGEAWRGAPAIGERVTIREGGSELSGVVKAIYPSDLLIDTGDAKAPLRMVSRAALDVVSGRTDGEPAARDSRLEWVVQAPSAGERDLELSYNFVGVSWSVSYTLIYDPRRPDRAELEGWLSIVNGSGMPLEGSRVTVIGGPVAVPAAHTEVAKPSASLAALGYTQQPGYNQKPVWVAPVDPARATIDVPFRIADGESRELPLFAGGRIELGARLLSVFDPVGSKLDRPSKRPITSESYGLHGTDGTDSVAMYVELDLEAAGLSELPPGKLRAFERQSDGTLRPVGAAQAFVPERNDEEPDSADETRVRIGRAGRIRAHRRQTDFSVDHAAKRLVEEIRVDIENLADAGSEVTVREHLYRGLNWSIAYHNDAGPVSKRGSQEIEFRVPVDGKGKARVVYRVVYTW